MVCATCAALSPELRDHPAPNGVTRSRERATLALLICVRCGNSRSFEESTDIMLRTLDLLNRFSMMPSAPPLLRDTVVPGIG